MGQVHIRVILTNHREAVMARLGQLEASRVHRYETEALIILARYDRLFLLPSLTVLDFFV